MKPGVKKYGKEKPQIVKSLEDKVFERPSFIDQLGATRLDRGRPYVEVAQSLKSLSPSQSIILSIDEFEEKFHLNGGVPLSKKLQTVRVGLKNRQVVEPKVVEYDGKIYIWSKTNKV